MTKIQLIDDGSLKKLVVNGKTIAYDGRITEIKKIGKGKWEGIASGYPFTIIGGKESGGSSREWFFHWPAGYGDSFVSVNSAVKALENIENC